MPGSSVELADASATYRRPNGARYLARNLGGAPDVEVLRRLRTAGLFVILRGEPGAGKTALIEAAFTDVVTIQCSGDMTVAHLLGTHLPTVNGGWEWHDGPLIRAMRDGAVLYLDEIDTLPQDISTILHAAMDGRDRVTIDDRPGSAAVVASPGFYVAAAYNPGALRDRRLSGALNSRFAVQIDVTTDFDAARALGVAEEFVTIAENLHLRSTEDVVSGGPGIWVPQMRELLAAQQLLDHGLGASFAASAMMAKCPVPEDLDEVRGVFEHVLGAEIYPLRLGRQW